MKISDRLKVVECFLKAIFLFIWFLDVALMFFLEFFTVVFYLLFALKSSQLLR
jgi:hypothetical protein